MTRWEIKERAKNLLGGSLFSTNWMAGVLAMLVYSVIISVVAFVPIIGNVAAIVIAGPMAYGLYYVFLNSARTFEKIDVADLFKGFSDDFGQIFLIGLMTTIFTALWSLLFVIPGIIKMYAYSMAYYIKADHPEYTWKQCLDESQIIMSGHKWELFVLQLSFIGWTIVGMMCLGIGVLWVEAYQYAAMSQFYESIK